MGIHSSSKRLSINSPLRLRMRSLCSSSPTSRNTQMCIRDRSIISFNNSLFARLTYPPLTSVDINSFQLGIEAAAQMISHIETPDLMATKTIVPHHIVARESCKAVIGETCV